MAALGLGFTVICAVAVPVHPLASVTVTVYPVVPAGDRIMVVVVAEVFHE